MPSTAMERELRLKEREERDGESSSPPPENMEQAANAVKAVTITDKRRTPIELKNVFIQDLLKRLIYLFTAGFTVRRSAAVKLVTPTKMVVNLTIRNEPL
jgi:hypothetical protein